MGNTFNFNGEFTQFGNNNSIIKTVNDASNNKDNTDKQIETSKVRLLELVSKGNLKEALHEAANAKNDEHTKRQVIQLLGRLNKLEVDIVAGTVNKQDEVFETNQIRNAILLFIEHL